MSINDLTNLIDSANKLVRELNSKLKEYTDGVASNKEATQALSIREDGLKIEKQKLADDKKSLEYMKDVDAHRQKNASDAKTNTEWYNKKREELSTRETKIDADRKLIDRKEADLVDRENQLAKDQKQLVLDRANYKNEVIRKLKTGAV